MRSLRGPSTRIRILTGASNIGDFRAGDLGSKLTHRRADDGEKTGHYSVAVVLSWFLTDGAPSKRA